MHSHNSWTEIVITPDHILMKNKITCLVGTNFNGLKIQSVVTKLWNQGNGSLYLSTFSSVDYDFNLKWSSLDSQLVSCCMHRLHRLHSNCYLKKYADDGLHWLSRGQQVLHKEVNLGSPPHTGNKGCKRRNPEQGYQEGKNTNVLQNFRKKTWNVSRSGFLFSINQVLWNLHVHGWSMAILHFMIHSKIKGLK